VKGVAIMSAEQKPICVVIDANIWLKDSNLLLRTAMGSALLYILKRIEGKIGLPSILEEEVIRNTITEGVKAAEAIQKNFKIISVIMGDHDSYTSRGDNPDGVTSKLKDILYKGLS
jgi:hypothetical protein